jgi:hypothetical protein
VSLVLSTGALRDYDADSVGMMVKAMSASPGDSAGPLECNLRDGFVL